MATALAASQYDFSDFDGGISHLLAKIEGEKTSQDIVNDLTNEVDNEVLQDVRSKLFNLCKDTYECRLREKGEMTTSESIEIYLIRRHNNNNEALAQDIVKLYQYAVGLKSDFPKDVLTRQSKLKEVVQKQDAEVDGSNKDNNLPRNTLHQKLFNVEVINMIKEQGRELEKLKREHRQQQDTITHLKGELQNAVKKISQLENQNKNEEQQTTTEESNATTPPGTGGIITIDDQEASHNPSNTDKPAPPKSPPNNNTNTSRVTHVVENGQTTTYLHKLGTQQSKPLEDYRDQQRQLQRNESNKRGSQPRLRGVRQEKGVMLYVTGINCEDKGEEEIKSDIKAHTREKGLRVMYIRLISHRMYQDTVSCKLLVPENQEYLALKPDFWPEDVKCRRWAKDTPRYRYDRNDDGYGRGYRRGYDSHYDRYDYDGNYNGEWS